MKIYNGMKVKLKKDSILGNARLNPIHGYFRINDVDEVNKCASFSSNLGMGSVSFDDFDNYLEVVDKHVINLIHNDMAMIVFLDDGSKGVSVCMEEDVFCYETGYEIAKLKAEIKSQKKKYKKYINDITVRYEADMRLMNTQLEELYN